MNKFFFETRQEVEAHFYNYNEYLHLPQKEVFLFPGQDQKKNQILFQEEIQKPVHQNVLTTAKMQYVEDSTQSYLSIFGYKFDEISKKFDPVDRAT